MQEIKKFRELNIIVGEALSLYEILGGDYILLEKVNKDIKVHNDEENNKKRIMKRKMKNKKF